MLTDGLNFSFSGLKSAVERFLAANPDAPPADVAASFVAAVLEVLVAKCRRRTGRAAVRVPGHRRRGGGQPQLRAAAGELCAQAGVRLEPAAAALVDRQRAP
jgi:N6-L-threonylcarbamoyladenine synthase